eukprot:TRINITY_DN10928_c0_g1_i12.p1 TRINITY_DN10928_c0_g1~~TRINITY_DN10928_c0_g1_i12.p1  ORF type:complete len:178 (+),score=37.73 TRINITY_DN10928_c0_g1_i12:62-535(+)
MPDGKTVDQPEWRTKLNLHLDMNPWAYVTEKTSAYDDKILDDLRYKRKQDFITENNHPGVAADYRLNIQGLMNLADNKEQDGGFQIVPGFHHHLERWAKSPKGMALVKRYGWRETFIMLPDDIEFHEHSIRVTARAGKIGRAVQQECRDRSRMPSSA